MSENNPQRPSLYQQEIMMEKKYGKKGSWTKCTTNGQFGKIYRTLDQNIRKVCVKEYPPNSDVDFHRERVAYEATAKGTPCPFLPKLYDWYETNSGKYLMMEWFDYNLASIFDRKPDYTEVDVQGVVDQVAKALEHCQKQGIIHRDVKPENILVRTWEPLQVALTDFNLAANLGATKGNKTIMYTCAGTPVYRAPEVYQTDSEYIQDKTGKQYHVQLFGRRHNEGNSTYSVSFNYKCDIWSLGCIAYQLLSGGFRPFRLKYDDISKIKEKLLKVQANDRLGKAAQLRFRFMLDHIFEEDIQFEPASTWSKVTLDGRSIISGMLKKLYTERMGYDEIFAHPWLNNIIPPGNLHALHDPDVIYEDDFDWEKLVKEVTDEQEAVHPLNVPRINHQTPQDADILLQTNKPLSPNDV